MALEPAQTKIHSIYNLKSLFYNEIVNHVHYFQKKKKLFKLKSHFC